NFDAFENRRSYWVYVFARLKDGTSLEAARTAIQVPYSSILSEVEAPLQEGMSEPTLEQFLAKEITVFPGAKGQSGLFDEVSTPLLMLLGVTGFVLLIACANLANLLLVRAVNRSGEIAVRLSLGAQRHQVVGQLLTESFLLGICGSAVGWLVARGTLHGLGALLPSEADMGLGAELGPPAFLFLGVLAVVTGLVGLFPALHTTGHDLSTTLKRQGGRAVASRTANRFRTSMATFQIALSMALLVSAGLFTKSLLNVSRVDLGLEAESLATFGLSPELNGYQPAESRALFARVEEAVAALPGVTHVAGSRVPLISGSNWGSSLEVEGFPSGPDTDTHANFSEVGPGFFEAVGIPVLAGRSILPSDTLESPKVTVVNETF
ncbi:MAG: FtsX-like permease family protein, partial [Holophagales bacterium]|nr:FtsX-like permease family protein [Holophagales bacterium]